MSNGIFAGFAVVRCLVGGSTLARVKGRLDALSVPKNRRGPHKSRSDGGQTPGRAGMATVDYVLVLGVMMPMIGLILWVGPQIMNLAYEILYVLVSWPFQ